VKLSLVLVTYHSSSVLGPCLESFRRELAGTGVDAEIIVADHSGDPAEYSRIREIAGTSSTVIPQENRGYAAGLNTGVRASAGEILFLANPDILFLSSSVTHLMTAVAGNCFPVGPALFWDRAGEIFLPPPEDPRPRAEMTRLFRIIHPGAWWRGLDAELDRIMRFWTGREAVPALSLRGPLMVLRRSQWDRLGPLDEGYFLYFEETEWLLRARRLGAGPAVIPTARIVHRWGHSTVKTGKAGTWEERSRKRFYRRNFPLSRIAIEGLRRFRPKSPWKTEKPGAPDSLRSIDADLFLFSPVPHFLPAAGWPGRGRWPAETGDLFSGGRWYGIAASRKEETWELEGPWTWGGG